MWSVRDFSVPFSVFARKNVTIHENMTFADSVSRNPPPDCSKLTKNRKSDNDATFFRNNIIVNFFFGVVLFLLSSLGTGPSFMSLSYLVLELWQFSFIRDWPEIRKSEILPFEFSTIFEDWGELWIPKFARMSLIERCWMLQNARVTA